METFKLSELFSSILIPGFFLLACILQLHYFNSDFLQLTDLEHIPARQGASRYEPSPETPAQFLSPLHSTLLTPPLSLSLSLSYSEEDLRSTVKVITDV